MEILGPVMEIKREEAQEWIEVIDGLLYDPQVFESPSILVEGYSQQALERKLLSIIEGYRDLIQNFGNLPNNTQTEYPVRELFRRERAIPTFAVEATPVRRYLATLSMMRDTHTRIISPQVDLGHFEGNEQVWTARLLLVSGPRVVREPLSIQCYLPANLEQDKLQRLHDLAAGHISGTSRYALVG